MEWLRRNLGQLLPMLNNIYRFVDPLRPAASMAKVPWVSVNTVHNCIPSRYICSPGFPDLGGCFYPIGWKLIRSTFSREIVFPRKPENIRDFSFAAQRGLSPLRRGGSSWWVRHHGDNFLNRFL